MGLGLGLVYGLGLIGARATCRPRNPDGIVVVVELGSEWC